MTRLFVERGGLIDPLPPQPAMLEQDHLHRLIQMYPGILPGDEIDPEQPCEWLLVGSEVLVPDPENGVDRWALDLLIGDQNSRPTLVECKRAGSAEIRREIIGQAIEYAANAQYYWDAAKLTDIARRQHTSDASLEEALQKIGWRDGAEAYFAEFERNLRSGEFRIIFAVDRAPHRLRSTVEFLNREFEHIEALVVEVRRHVVGDTTVIASGVLGYSETLRASKREASTRRDRRSYDDDSFIELIDSLGNRDLSSAARHLLSSSRLRGWNVRFSANGSLLLSPEGFMGRTAVAVIPAKGGLLEWYLGEFEVRSPPLAEALRKLAVAIGATNAAKYPRTLPNIWAQKLERVISGLDEIGRANAAATSA